jgi:3-oxoacyl-[acyl-carrier-protein] synthase III
MIKFSGISMSLGSIEEGNSELEKKFGWEEGKISAKTGINRRFISSSAETPEILAARAVANLEKNLIIDDIDCIISTTNTQTNIFPALAYHILLDKKFNSNVQCFGLNVGCTGFVDALVLAYSGIASKLYKKVLIVTADTYSKFIQEQDQSTRPLFSDGASATLIEFDEDGYILQDYVSTSVPDTLHHLCMMKDKNLKDYIHMNGPNILTFAVGKVLPGLTKIINPDLEYTFYPHQAGKLVLDTFEKKLSSNISMKKNYSDFGNLVSGSIPNLIHDSCPDLNLQKNIILSGFGVGLAHTSLIFKK